MRVKLNDQKYHIKNVNIYFTVCFLLLFFYTTYLSKICFKINYQLYKNPISDKVLIATMCLMCSVTVRASSSITPEMTGSKLQVATVLIINSGQLQ